MDATHLERAIELAERGRGTTHPNPIVGAVVVADGEVVGEGWHERKGEAHAEVIALAAAGIGDVTLVEGDPVSGADLEANAEVFRERVRVDRGTLEPRLRVIGIDAWSDEPGFAAAVEADGNICIATLAHGGITIVSPDGGRIEHVPMPDMHTTNICFGGEGLRTAYVTLSGSGRLVALPWPRPGLALNT